MLRASNVFVCLRTATRSFSQAAPESIDTTRARLLYQSKKRGILENDILLGDFATENLGSMDKETLGAYDRLINGTHMEWDLFYYLSDKKVPPTEVSDCPAFKLLKTYVDSRKSPR